VISTARSGLRAAPSITLAVLLASSVGRAQSRRDEPSVDNPPSPVDPSRGEEEHWSLHFQSTVATQWHPAFAARYSGLNSMSPEAESATAFVSTLYADVGLWPGGEVLFNPEISGGKGQIGRAHV